MPSYLGGPFDIFGLKWIGSNPWNWQHGLPRAIGTIVLNDPVTKFPVAFMDGTIISAMRTAAVSSLAVSRLAGPCPRALGLIGLGVIGKTQLKGILKAAPSIEKIKVFDLDKGAEKAFIEYARSITACEIETVPRVMDVFHDIDIVVPCTTASEGYIEGDWIEKGLLFINVSIMDPKREAVLRSDKIVVDDWEQCNRENKILNILYREGKITERSIYAELGEILAGRKPGRESDDEIIFFNPMGMSIEDIASAYRIFRVALERGVGMPLELFKKGSVPVWI
jgi:ornithine cyclodeaminase